MKPVIRTSLGFDVPVLYYESLEEADKESGNVGDFLTEGNNNLYYRGGCAQEAREIIAEEVEKITKITRETRPVMRKVKQADGSEKTEQAKDREGALIKEYVLDEEAYVKGALAKAGITPESIQNRITAAISSSNKGEGIRVDIRKKERKPAPPKTLPTKFLEAAKSAISNGKVKKVAADFKSLCYKDLASTTDPVVVGWAIKEIVAALEAKAVAAY